MKIEGFTVTTEDLARLPLAFRFYGTRETVTDDAGEERPHPNRWSLVREVRALADGAAYTLPDFDLPRTESGRWRFFYPVPVMPDGREVWHAGAEITFPARASRPSAVRCLSRDSCSGILSAKAVSRRGSQPFEFGHALMILEK